MPLTSSMAQDKGERDYTIIREKHFNEADCIPGAPIIVPF